MRYVDARAEQKRRDNTYRIYVTDCLYAIANGGHAITKRYADIINPEPKKPKDTRSQAEIVAQVWSGINGKGGEK